MLRNTVCAVLLVASSSLSFSTWAINDAAMGGRPDPSTTNSAPRAKPCTTDADCGTKKSGMTCQSNSNGGTGKTCQPGTGAPAPAAATSEQQ